MKSHSASFDRLARPYRALEFLAFGRDLERARLFFVRELRGCRRILILGEGDGRFLARLLEAAPGARIHCVDSSPAMLALAAARISGSGAEARVSFERADALRVQFAGAAFDGVVTNFFLDCLSPAEVVAVESRVRPSLCEGAHWLFADFVLPPEGFRRLRARAWLRILYVFFGWTTGLTVRSLPPSVEILEGAGYRRVAAHAFQGGLVQSMVFKSPSLHARPCSEEGPAMDPGHGGRG